MSSQMIKRVNFTLNFKLHTTNLRNYLWKHHQKRDPLEDKKAEQEIMEAGNPKPSTSSSHDKDNHYAFNAINEINKVLRFLHYF